MKEGYPEGSSSSRSVSVAWVNRIPFLGGVRAGGQSGSGSSYTALSEEGAAFLADEGVSAISPAAGHCSAAPFAEETTKKAPPQLRRMSSTGAGWGAEEEMPGKQRLLRITNREIRHFG